MSIPPRALALVALLVAGPAARAGLESFTVNSTKDLPDLTPLGDGVVDADLDAPGEQVTLRAAIQEANALAGADSIVLPAGKYVLKRKGSLENGALTGDLDVTDDLTIVGAGATTTTIDAKKAKDRVFHVLGARLTLSGVTLRKGKPTADAERGGGVLAEAGAELIMNACVVQKCKSVDDGGGVALVDADATITDTTFLKNKSSDDGGGLDTSSSGTVTVERCAFVANRAKREGGAFEGSEVTATIVNTTFYKNKAQTGGALQLQDGGTYELVNCTVAKNRAKVDASGLAESVGDSDDEVIRIANSLFDNWKKRNYSGDGVTSLGHNLDSGETFGFAGPGDLGSTTPRLGKLSKGTGAPPTVALKAASPAIDAADDALAPMTDQRGLPRVDQPDVGSATADIGAYERQ
ncbi:MAG: choice-of-anchor Q domain-containing protein [Planctomycetota bacterium JB042]